MQRQSLIWVGVLIVGSALGLGARLLGQDRVKVEVTVPAVPTIGNVAPASRLQSSRVRLGESFISATAGPITSQGVGEKAMPCSATPTTNSGPIA